MNGLKYLLAFGIGVVIGGAVAWKYKEKQAEEYITTEANAIREYYKERYSNSDSKKNEEEQEDAVEFKHASKGTSSVDGFERQTPPVNYATKISIEDYQKTHNIKVSDHPAPMMEEEGINIFEIDMEKYGEDETYETECLIAYSNGVLVDDQGEVIEEPERYIGLGTMDMFDKDPTEDYYVYVQNDVNHTYYEVEVSGNIYEGYDS